MAESKDDAKPSGDANEEARNSDMKDADLKIILLGDSAVGKSKLIERYLMDNYVPRQLSTYALTLYRKAARIDTEDGDVDVEIDFWDTAGQERFSSMHPSYYSSAHCCILVFDVTRKQTYQHLTDWYKELRASQEGERAMPCILVANKIDIDPRVTNKEFKFAKKNGLNMHFASAADGTNCVKIFEEAMREAHKYRSRPAEEGTVSDMLAFLDEKSPLDKEAEDK